MNYSGLVRQNPDEVISVLLTHLYRDMSRAISQQTGMSFSRWLILHELAHDGELSQAEIQKRLGMEGALVTRFVKQMETARLLTRRADPEDNRYTLVALTPNGHREFEKMKDLRARSEDQLLAGLDEKEKNIVVHALKRIQDNISRWQTEERKLKPRS